MYKMDMGIIDETINQILNYYSELERKNNEPRKYYFYRTGDSPITIFERLSLCNKIGITSRLSDNDSKIVLQILFMICNKNYTILHLILLKY